MERRGSGIPLNLAEMKERQRVSVTKIRTTANCNLLELITRHFFSPSRPLGGPPCPPGLGLDLGYRPSPRGPTGGSAYRR